jgi:hypothetical protein
MNDADDAARPTADGDAHDDALLCPLPAELVTSRGGTRLLLVAQPPPITMPSQPVSSSRPNQPMSPPSNDGPSLILG